MTVLLADEIRKLCVSNNGEPSKDPLISPFNPAQLRPASYQLTLGREIHIGGRKLHLGDSNEHILEPHQVAVVSTKEVLSIPRNLIARWSIRVAKIYEGLLWTGGPQVDPGWHGPLFCPIYNLSERQVVLKFGDGMFTIDFVSTTPVGPALMRLKEDKYYKKVWFTPERHTLEEHDSHRLHSAPYEALKDLRELSVFRSFANLAVSIMILVLTLMVGALAVVMGTARVDASVPFSETLFWWIFGSLAFLSIGSCLMCLWLFSRVRRIIRD